MGWKFRFEYGFKSGYLDINPGIYPDLYWMQFG